MDLLVQILLNNILPIFLAIGAGYALARLTDFELGGLSKATLYVFSPMLLYRLLAGSQFETSEVLRISAVSVASIVSSGGLAWLISRAMKLTRVMTMAFVLVAMFANAGNYGLSLNLLAFGEEAAAQAAIYFVISSITAYTLGLYLASSGRLSAREALRSVLGMPHVYAVAFALLSFALKVEPPPPVWTAITVLSNAAIPCMLVLLGAQMAHVARIQNVGLATVASGLRLAVAPVLTLLLAGALHVEGVARQATVLEASMPTAVLVTLLATEFDLEPGFVVSTVALSTLLSPISLTLLVAFLS